jgi:uncharacterized membrane protein
MTLPSAWARRATLVLHAVLIAGLVAAGGAPGALIAVPLLVLLPALWRARPYMYAVASLLIVFYVGGFLMEAFSRPARDAVALGLATTGAFEFVALVLFVRLRAVEARRAAAVSGTPASPDRSR